MNKTFFIAAVFAVATALAAGLTVLPGSVQEAQANPCANEVTESGGGVPASEVPQIGGAQNSFNPQGDDDRECDLTGSYEFDEGGTSDNGLAATETEDEAATETEALAASEIDVPLLNLADLFDESD